MEVEECNLLKLLSSPIDNEGYELLEVKFAKNDQINTIKLFIFHEQGIDIEDCVTVSQIAKGIIENNYPIYDNFTLEVSSPGIFRELKFPKHFNIYKGKRIKVKLKQKIQGIKIAFGKVKEIYQDGIILKIENANKTIIIPFSLISKANLEPLIYI